MPLRPVIALCLLALSAAAHASSDAAWAAFDTKVARACVTASGLAKARSSRVIGFDDALGKVVVLVTGIAPRAPRPASMLCVFDQRSGRTWLSEAEGWRAPPR